MTIQRGKFYIEVRENVRGETVVEVYVGREVDTSPYSIADEVITYLLAESFLENRPVEIAVYNKFGVNIFR